jgi:hypothetical protein
VSEPELSPEEIEGQDASALPDREAMSLLDVNADLDLALDIAAPINAAVAANANAALPIDAAVSANVASVASQSAALADQTSVIDQDLDGTAIAESNQDATLDQSDDTP